MAPPRDRRGSSKPKTPTLRELLDGPPTRPLYPDVAQIMQCGRSKIFDLATRGELPFPVFKIGNRYLVPVLPLARWLGYEDIRPEDTTSGATGGGVTTIGPGRVA
ncbi:helix-turn-helix domain-containing protein [Parafrankia soli]|uniref:helix-turn-helix domain-containing protein n=1 Tax=Parafrankia soli TaxID=2599596 RepID=UPI0010420635|nr:helix-turn-helix domain-containing protein [Parafrankia soli]